MRRLAVTTVALVLLLAGCSGTSKNSATPEPAVASCAKASPALGSTPAPTSTASAADGAALTAIKVKGSPGTKPTFTFSQPFKVSSIVSCLITPGTGATLAEGQILAIHYSAVNGPDGKDVGSSFGAATVPLTVGDANNGAEMNSALTGQKVGSRLLFGVPGAEGAEILLLEVVGAQTVPDRAQGTAVAPVAGLPTVTLAANGAPTITPVPGAAPTALVAQPLIKGSGATVADGQTVTVNYSGWLWDGTAFDSSWKGAKFTAPLTKGSIIDGWIKGLVGQTVGSQVLLVIPPDLGYKAQAQGSIPANSTLVFVVDILGVAPGSAPTPTP